jgi:hypothetical protein
VPRVLRKIVVSECLSRATVPKNRSVEGLSVETKPVGSNRGIIYRSIKRRRFSTSGVHISSKRSGSVNVMALIICADKRGGKFEKTSEGQIEEDVRFATAESPHSSLSLPVN